MLRAILMVCLATASAATLAAEPTAAASPASSGARTAASRRFDPVAKVTSVTARDAQGRVSRFRDTGNREFQISYDARGRVASAKAALRAHVSDVNSVAYDEQGRFIGAQLGAGYVLYASYLEDGSQILRDSRGASIVRQGNLRTGYRAAHVDDPTGRLGAAAAGMDALIKLATPAR